MLGAGNLDVAAPAEPFGGPFVGLFPDAVVLGRLDDGDRDAHSLQGLGFERAFTGVQRESQPAPCRAADRQVRAGVELLPPLFVAALVRSQGVLLEGVVERIVGVVENIVPGLAVTQVPADGQFDRPHRPLAGADAQHGAGQDGAGEPALAALQRHEVQRAAHGVTDHDPRLGRTILPGVEQAGVVVEEFLDRPGVALQPIGQQTGGKALTAPVVGQDAPAPGEEIADDLIVFLDRFGTAGTDDHGPARLFRHQGGRRPEGGAQAQAAGAAEPFADPARRRGRARDPHQGRIGGIGGGSVHSGFLNLKVMRSLSPISSYFDRSKFGFGGEPRGAVSPMGGRVSTPNG